MRVSEREWLGSSVATPHASTRLCWSLPTDPPARNPLLPGQGLWVVKARTAGERLCPPCDGLLAHSWLNRRRPLNAMARPALLSLPGRRRQTAYDSLAQRAPHRQTAARCAVARTRCASARVVCFGCWHRSNCAPTELASPPGGHHFGRMYSSSHPEVVKLPPPSYTPAYTPTSTYATSTYLSPTRRYSPRGASHEHVSVRASGRCRPDNCVAAMLAGHVVYGHDRSMPPLRLGERHSRIIHLSGSGAAESAVNDGGAGALMDEHAELMALVRRHGAWSLVPGVAPPPSHISGSPLTYAGAEQGLPLL
jgi:hypothetical protein